MKKVLVVLALVLCALPGAAFAQKIGMTDSELLLVNLPEFKTVQETIGKETQTHQQEMQTKATAFQTKVEAYQKQQSLLSEESRQKKEQELQTEQQQLQQLATQKQQIMQQREEELLTPLYAKVQSAIDEVAKAHNLDVVLRPAVGSQPVILYRNENTVMDITEEVARKLNIPINPAAAAGTPATPPTSSAQ